MLKHKVILKKYSKRVSIAYLSPKFSSLFTKRASSCWLLRTLSSEKPTLLSSDTIRRLNTYLRLLNSTGSCSSRWERHVNITPTFLTALVSATATLATTVTHCLCWKNHSPWTSKLRAKMMPLIVRSTRSCPRCTLGCETMISLSNFYERWCSSLAKHTENPVSRLETCTYSWPRLRRGDEMWLALPVSRLKPNASMSRSKNIRAPIS